MWIAIYQANIGTLLFVILIFVFDGIAFTHLVGLLLPMKYQSWYAVKIKLYLTFLHLGQSKAYVCLYWFLLLY